MGRTSLAIAAFTDVSLALAFVKGLPDQEKVKKEAEILEAKSTKMRQRKKEADAHKKNVRFGKKK